MAPPPADHSAAGWTVTRTSLRTATAAALLGLAGVLIGFGALRWMLPPGPIGIEARFDPQRFTQLPVLVGPLLAVLVATRPAPPLPLARAIGVAALAEYVTALLFAGFGTLITVGSRFDRPGRGVYLLGGLLDQLGDVLVVLLHLLLLVLAGIWTGLLHRAGGGRLPWLPFD